MNRVFWKIVARSLFIFFPLAALLVGITTWIYIDGTRREYAKIGIVETGVIALLANAVDTELNRVGADLVFLAAQAEFNNIDGQLKHPNIERFAGNSESLIATDDRYRQIVFVDNRGFELMRFNRRNNDIVRASNADLRNVAYDYSFGRVIVRIGGEVTVSPVVEQETRINRAQVRSTMVRFSTPITDGRGKTRGVVTLDYVGAQLLEQAMRSYDGSRQVLLVDSGGYVLAALIPDTSSAIGHVNWQGKRLGQHFPDAWTMMADKTTGQFRSAEGLFTYRSILSERPARPDDTSSAKRPQLQIIEPASKVPSWRIVTYVPSNWLDAAPRPLLSQLVILDAFLILLLLMGSFFVARFSINGTATEFGLNIAEMERRDRTTPTKRTNIAAVSNSILEVGEDNFDFIETEIPGPLSLQTSNLNSDDTLSLEKRAAYYDTLTKLPNLTFFKEFLNRAIARAERYVETLVLLYVDLDDFDRLNAAHGRDVGKTYLKIIASRLAKSLRQSDFIAHPSMNEVRLYRASHVSEVFNDLPPLANDQFLIMLHEIKHNECVAQIAERILNDVSAPVQLGEIRLTTTCSIGISILPDDEQTVDGLIEKGNIAMQHAKKGGKNGYTLYGSIASEALLDAESAERSS